MPAFLFTDLESSTRLWEAHPDQMRVSLARHDTILRQAIEEARGTIVKMTGDGLLATFDSPADALIATVNAQRGFAGENWSTPEPLRVRMGIHIGEGEKRDGDYFGPAVNRAARIMSAGHGGQVLVSGAAAGMLSDSLPEGVALRDLGLHRLKDLTLPEHLFQLIHPGLESEFPSPATLEAAPNNLPLQVTEFFGREAELASIQLMLGAPTTRLLTLTGPGGAGKTRLGLQVAAEQVNRFKDGVFFVDLAPETDPDSAYEAMVRAMDFPMSSGGHPLQVLKTRLRDRQALLVLDNFEQVTDAAAGIVELVQSCQGVKILVTSREALRVRAETVFPVPALSLPHPEASVASIAESEAVRLFVERAGSVRPGFALGEDNAAVIAEICLRLDGLPLAIELAAARLNVFTPQELMGRLRGRLDILGAGGRDLPARQRTLWGAIGWSYELLDADEKKLFEIMSIFSATKLSALEAVAGATMGQGFILDLLGSLVDKSLIRSTDADGYQVFSMLQTIKEYAQERLAESAEFETEVRRSHAIHFSSHAHDLGRELRGPGRAAALEDLALSIGNLRTAWRHWVDVADIEQIVVLIDALWALHDAKGWYHAAIELANDALSVFSSVDTGSDYSAEELTLRTSLARALMAVQGYTVEVEEAFKKVLEMSAATGASGAQRFPVLRALATYYMNISDFPAAARLGAELLELAEREGDPSILIDGHYVFGAATAFAGDLDVGMAHLDKAIELFDPRVHAAGRFRLGPSQGVVARVASGLILWQCGGLDRAVARVGEGLDLARELRHPFSLAYGLYHDGLLQFYRGRYQECRERAIELAGVATEHDYQVWETLAAVLEGVSLTGLGQVEDGLTLTEEAVDLYRGLTTPPVFWPLILALRGFVFAMAGNPGRGLELIDEAIEASGSQQELISPQFFLVRGDMLRMMAPADVEDAGREYEIAAERSNAAGLYLIELEALTRMVQLKRGAGITPDDSERLRARFDAFTEGFAEDALVAAAQVLAEAQAP